MKTNNYSTISFEFVALEVDLSDGVFKFQHRRNLTFSFHSLTVELIAECKLTEARYPEVAIGSLGVLPMPYIFVYSV